MAGYPESPMPLATLALPVAHAGHWALWILYLVPVIVVLAAIGTAIVRERRAQREGATRSPGT